MGKNTAGVEVNIGQRFGVNSSKMVVGQEFPGKPEVCA